MNFPDKCVVDTNVPKVANSAPNPEESDFPEVCVLACVAAIEQVMLRKSLVIDSGNEIFDEYRQQLSLGGQPGVGDVFMKWVHDRRWLLPEDQRVSITPNGDSYNEFPAHHGLTEFDRSDRKFVAVANAHPEQPPILQATDSKWWGWKEALREVGITVRFVCPEHIQEKYREKMGE